MLHQANRRALGVGIGLGRTHGIFQPRQGFSLFFYPRGQHAGVGFALFGLLRQVLNFILCVLLAGSPLRHLLFERCQALHDALTAFHHKADFGLKPPDFRAGLVQQPLGLIDLRARVVMRLANTFQVSLDAAQVSGSALQRVNRRTRVLFDFVLVSQRFRTLQKPLLMLLERHIDLQGFVLTRHLGLGFELFQVGIEFPQDVAHTGQVFTGIGQAVLGFAATLFVFGDAGGFFQKQAQLFGFAFNDA